MSTFTENYNLIKPGEEDYYDVQDFNENMDSIDAQMMETERSIAGVSEKIGNSADSGDSTVFAKLNALAAASGNGVQLIKSIQHRTYSVAKETSSGTCSLSPKVTPSRCLVIFERLADNTSSGCAYISYSLGSDAISISHSSYSNSSNTFITVGFWVVEFY